MSVLTPIRRRRCELEQLDMAALVADRWRWTLAGTEVAQAVQTVSGPTITVPTVVGVDLGGETGPIVLTVRLLAGQLPEDLVAVGPRIAQGMACAGIRVRPFRPGYAHVSLLLVDPLAGVLSLDTSGPGLLLGRGEDGDDLRVDPVELPHIICQGQTRSGKSTWLYALLVQLVRRGDVIVAGVDPSGITLRPFVGTVHQQWQTLGLSSLDAIEATLAVLVADMDARLAAMPADRDILPVGPDWPLIVTVLDEWPATLRALDAADPKQGKRCRALVARLLAESHKVGHRLVIAAQRAEAAIVGAAERAQCAGRLTFRVDSSDTVKLLHPDGDEHAAAHTSALPGIALVTWPGRPLSRLRAPFLGGYREYVAAITAACRSDH